MYPQIKNHAVRETIYRDLQNWMKNGNLWNGLCEIRGLARDCCVQ
jgi:hypothetical protein